MAHFVGYGKYVPPFAETNEEVAARLGISASEIVSKTGISCRYLARDESASAMALKAIRQALQGAGIDASRLGGVVVSAYTGDYLYPNLASKLCRELQIRNCYAYDLNANCAGFQMALATSSDYLRANPAVEYVAVVGVAKQSPYLDPANHETAMFFSDAASAVILRQDAQGLTGILTSYYETHGEYYEIVRLRAGGSSFPFSTELLRDDPKALQYEHSGLGVWSEVIVELPKLVRRSLKAVGWSTDDVSTVLFHQANLKLISFCMARLSMPMSKTITNVQDIGNTADASLGTVLFDAYQQGRLSRSGDRVVMASVGAGFVYVVTPYIVP